MSAWTPSDGQLDALARGLPPLVPAAERTEQLRTSVLASAATAKQQARRSGAAVAAAIALPLAAAAAIAIWIGTRPRTEPTKDAVSQRDGARIEIASNWPDRILRLDDGTIDVDLQPLDPHERFRMRVPDGELESRDGRFTLEVRSARVTFVSVARGQIELRVRGLAPVVVAAGQAWSPPITTQRDVIVPKPDIAPSVATPVEPNPAPGTEKRDGVPRPAKLNTAEPKPTKSPGPRTAQATTPSPTQSVPESPKPVAPGSVPDASPGTQPPPPSPGEAEFRAGMIALRNGDAGAAAASFATACSSARAALAEDACFWVGAAAHRAKQLATARDALSRFLQRFPSSSRAGEAAALLGWMLLEAGDLDDAERRFKLAANDRVPKVRESAARGLTAIARKRGK